ncbi:MAG TPA: MlaD family protein [Lacunisphaera sp.]|nr:MlaD family protein [Lacunisphaera sp.]
MKTKLSPSTVGMFVLGALLVGVVAFLSFGGSNIFAKPTRFLVYFDESVSGLDPGAPVKLNGVRVGRVAAINVRYETGSKALVQVVCEIHRNVLVDPKGKPIDLTSTAELQKLIDRGLRAGLSLTGITGLLFVELDFNDPHQYPADPRFVTEAYPVVPSIPSPISQVQQSIVEIVANLKKVDFAGLAKDICGVLAATNQKINDLDVKGLTERVGRAADSVNAFVSSPEAKQAFANLNGAITEARAALAKVDQNTGPVADQLKQTLADAQSALKSLDAAATATRTFVRDQGQVGDDVAVALRQVADAAASLERLADAIERNPSSLLVGKKKK